MVPEKKALFLQSLDVDKLKTWQAQSANLLTVMAQMVGCNQNFKEIAHFSL
jgi:hypothetical protein